MIGASCLIEVLGSAKAQTWIVSSSVSVKITIDVWIFQVDRDDRQQCSLTSEFESRLVVVRPSTDDADASVSVLIGGYGW